MFVMPLYFSGNNENDPVYIASSLSSLGRHSSVSRSSITSSRSSIGLRRTSSIISSRSSSTNASSVEPASPRLRLGRSFSNTSSQAQRRLQKKHPKVVLPEPQPKEEAVQEDVSKPEPVTPPSPTVEAPPRVVTGGSDLLIRCKHDVYHVDKDIMCYFSRWFRTVCAVVPTPKDSKTVIDLGADDPDAVASMIQYCYQLDYAGQLTGSATAVPEVITLRSHIDVFMLAERYGISGLKTAALQKFEDIAAKVFTEAGCEEQLLQAIRVIYASGRIANADALRIVMIQLCASHVEAFLNGTERTMALVFELMDEFPEFRLDLFEEMSSRLK